MILVNIILTDLDRLSHKNRQKMFTPSFGELRIPQLLLQLWGHDSITPISNRNAETITIQPRKTSFHEDPTEHVEQAELCRYSYRDYDGNEMGEMRYHQIHDQRQRSCNIGEDWLIASWLRASYQK